MPTAVCHGLLALPNANPALFCGSTLLIICCCTLLLLLLRQLVPLESSKLKGLVNTRVGVMQEIGWDPEWEVRLGEVGL